MSFLEFFGSNTDKTYKIEGFGSVHYFFDANGKHIGYTRGDYDDGLCEIVSFPIAEGNWYSDFLDALETEFGAYDHTFDKNGLSYYIWRIV